jgi:hypothetical protein
MSEPTTQPVPFSTDDDEFSVATPAASSTVLDALKAERARAAEPQTFDLDVPGWHGKLRLRLGSITAQQQQRIIERAQRRNANAQLDFLVAAFREVLGRARTSEPFQLLVDDDGDPLGLDERLADKLGLGPVSSARDVVMTLFGSANSAPVAITNAAGEWLEWAGSANGEIDQDFLGE